MKKLFIVTIAATTLGFGLPVYAAGEHAHHDHAHMSHGGENMIMQGEGTIKRLSGGKVTLKHGPIGTEMPPMTMEFSVSDASLLEGLEKGDEVTFTMTKGMVITEISPK